jgi:poly-gamma-glutamate synthesis protein (capsule biosynthesis protein)
LVHRASRGPALTGVTEASDPVRLFVAGDVMLGRGIDQVLPHPGDPRIHEDYVRSALDYLHLAEARNGPIPRRAGFGYVWGELLAELAARAPDLRLINLETAVTARGRLEPKGINYRMHPANLPALAAAGIDACVLANNHVLDWGRQGLEDTLNTLAAAGIGLAGAGRNLDEARAPLVLPLTGGRRLLLMAFASEDSGVPPSWAATESAGGVSLLPRDTAETVASANHRLAKVRRPGDVAVVSLHWGENWGYAIDAGQQALAHALIDDAGIDLVFGHSSHHPKAVEIHGGGLVLYGCGDLVNDYEGIAGHAAYRGDLVLAWFVGLWAGRSSPPRLEMVPLRLRRFRLEPATEEDAAWLATTLDRGCVPFGGRVALEAGPVLRFSPAEA